MRLMPLLAATLIAFAAPQPARTVLHFGHLWDGARMLNDVVVVVEATLRGGARITAQYALEYGRTVLAVPGSRRNAADVVISRVVSGFVM